VRWTAFTYGGAFALQLARKAERVIAWTSASKRGRKGGSGRAQPRRERRVQVANAFDLLRAESEAGARYDTIVLDPPAFAKSKDTIEAALRGYKEINLRAFHLMSPGGVLVTCSCSFQVDDATFERTVLQAASDAKRKRPGDRAPGAAKDHLLCWACPRRVT